MTDISTWSATDASNNSAAPAGFPDTIPVFSLPASSRAIMGAVARFYASLPGGGVYTAGTGLTLTGAQFSLQTPVTVARGGTNATSASGTALDNISGFASTGLMRRTGAGAYSFGTTVSNGELANSSITLNSHSVSLGGSLSLTLADISADPLAVGHGGTGGSSASGTLLDNITGFASTGLMRRTGAGTYTFGTTVSNGELANSSVTLNSHSLSLGGSLTLAFSDFSGTVAATQLPNPSSSTLGGVESYTLVANQFLTSISTSGVPASAQPSFANVSGTIASSQMALVDTDMPGAVQAVMYTHFSGV